tara:strand:- start:142 stop:2316 length:2175 start_codon:yes stop_codon:yes gene_type:complete
MSDDKKYSPVEVANMVAKRLRDCLKKHEVGVETLQKSANSSHEIDAGEEPNNDDAECPASLAAASFEGQESSDNSGQAEYSEDSESEEDDMNPDDYAVDSESEDSEEDDSEEDDSEEDDYEFKKSEACGHTIEYKTMKKGALDFLKLGGTKTSAQNPKSNTAQGQAPKPATGTSLASKIGWPGAAKPPVSKGEGEDGKVNSSFDREKKDVEWTKDQNEMVNATKPGKKPSNRQDQADHIAAAKKRRAKFKAEDAAKAAKKVEKSEAMKKCKDKDDCDCDESPKGELEKNNDNKVKETKGITTDKVHESDKAYEEKQGLKRPLEKCGDMIEAKKSEKLSSFLKKKEEKLSKGSFGGGYNMSGAAIKQDTAKANQVTSAKNAASQPKASKPLPVSSSAMSEAGPTRNKQTAMQNQKINDFNSKPASIADKYGAGFKAAAQNMKTGQRLTPSPNDRKVNSNVDLRNTGRDNLKRMKQVDTQGIKGNKNKASAMKEHLDSSGPEWKGKTAYLGEKDVPKKVVAPEKKAVVAKEKGAPAAKEAVAGGKKRSAFGQAFDKARALRESGKGGDTFKFKGKSYHTYHKDEMDNKGSKYKSTPEQKAAYKQKISGKKEAVRQAPARQEQAPARQEQAPARQTSQRQERGSFKPDISRQALRRDQRAGRISGGDEQVQASSRPSLRDRLGAIKQRRENRQQQVNRITGSGPRFMKSEGKLAKFVGKRNDLAETK